ncbi:MAG: right-handed parallel beta-helix repeat-containing protein [Opitutales bacterium]|nr:right-handed parallel beta-helix repeat-containing protein [Opitutales bacterium]
MRFFILSLLLLAAPLIRGNPTVSLSLPESVEEGGADGFGTVQISEPASPERVIFLQSSHPTRLTVPASVTIPEGQTEVAFSVSAVDNTIADGDVEVTVTASLPGAFAGEDFNYPAQSNIVGQDGGFGFSQPWSSASSDDPAGVVVSASLAFGSGESALYGGPTALQLVNGIRVQRNFSDITSGDLWLAALIGKQSTGWNTDFGLIDTGNQTRVTLRYNGEQGRWDVSQRDGSQLSTGVSVSIPSTHLAIMHLDLDEREARIFLNREPGEPLGEPDLSFDLVSGFSGFRAVQWFGFNNDDLLDSIRLARSYEELFSSTTAMETITVLDNDENGEAQSLTLMLPDEILENEEPQPGQLIRIGGSMEDEITVFLSSSNPNRLHVPTSVTLPSGHDTASFSLTPIDNLAFDGDVSVSISALDPAAMATEDFSYPASSNLADRDGGTGWTTPWYTFSSTNPPGMVVSSDFSYTRQGITVSSAPTSAQMVSGARMKREFSPVGEGQLWVSALIRKAGFGNQTTFGLIDSAGDTRLSIRYNSSTSQWESWIRDNPVEVIGMAATPPFTLHVVFHIDYAAGQIHFYLNPDLVGSAPTNPTASLTRSMPGGFPALKGVYWLGYNNNDLFDSIRVARSFAELRTERSTQAEILVIDDDALTDYQLWTHRHFATIHPEGETAGPDSPHPVSRLPNLLHYAITPSVASGEDAEAPILPSLHPDPEEEYMGYLYRRTRTDVNYLVETSTDLTNWSTDEVDQGEPDLQGWTLATFPGTDERRFARLRVEAISAPDNPGSLDQLAALSEPLDLNDTQINLINQRIDATTAPWQSELPRDAEDTANLTPADNIGPDDLVYPDWIHAGIPGGIPSLPVVVNASDHGVLPNGEPIADNLRAALAAAAQSGGGAVLLPAGTYQLEEPVNLNHAGVVLRGEGSGETIIEFPYQGPPDGSYVGFANAGDGDIIGPNSHLILHARTKTDHLRLTQMEIFGPEGEVLTSHAEGEPEWYRYPAPLDRPANFTVSISGSQLIQALGTGTHELTARTTYVLESITHEHTISLQVSNNQSDSTVRSWSPSALSLHGSGPSGQTVRYASETLPRGGTSLTLNNADPIQPGDFIALGTENNEAFNEERFNQHSGATNGILRRWVVEVIAREGNTLTLAQPARITWPVEDSITVRRWVPLQGSGIENLTIRQTGDQWTSGIIFGNAARCWIEDVVIEDVGRNPVQTWDVKQLEFRDSAFHGAIYTDGGGGTAYVAWQVAYDCLMDGITSSGMRHAPNFQWSSSGNVIRNSTFMDSGGQWHAGFSHENLLENVSIHSTGEFGSYRFGLFASVANGMHGPQGPRNVVYYSDVNSYGGGIKIGGMVEGWIFAHNRIVAHDGPALVLLPGSFGHTFRNNVLATAQPNPSPVWVSTADCTDNRFWHNHYTGVGDLPVYSGGAVPGEVIGETLNPDFATPLPSPPDTPSIFQWQRDQLP